MKIIVENGMIFKDRKEAGLMLENAQRNL